MSDLIDREHLLGEIEKLKKSPWYNGGKESKNDSIVSMYHIEYLARKEAVGIVTDLCVRQEPPVTLDAVSRGVFEQVKWERDVAIEQLKELGYGLGEKPRNDVLSREAIEDIKTEIETELSWYCFDDWGNETAEWSAIKEILERHISRKENE